MTPEEVKAEGETRTKSPEKQKARAARSNYENPDTTAAEQDPADGASTSTALEGGKGADIVLEKGGRSKKFNYIVHVLTSPEDDSGTDARVHLTLSGKGGTSQPLALDITNCVSDNTTLFQEGQVQFTASRPPRFRHPDVKAIVN
ncbi:hypothetical protein CYMTET_49127 [Cymbomonas tetramitiformis]|uniref:Uncharacterized protein n=1 Tax=Cymbomonas tetramitiformis TaxID=36881 RepID=A0AAE0BQQ3_9CHLO|nr:hypothetical protein CYMTET_49127 [Cymbomonas tetramitiformis]